MTNNVIEVRHVKKSFGDIQALNDVSLCVEHGEVFGLIGHNGAGKSTLFKSMLGLIQPDAGDILINGTPLHGEAFRQVRRRIGYLPENIVFYDNLTGLETLWFFADLKGVHKSECLAVLKTVGLDHAARRRVRGYSKGMRQRLGFAQALLGKPDILFLDEPTTGLDPVGIREFYGIISDLKKQGATIILTSHILAEIQERVDRLALMSTGRVQAVGTVHLLRENLGLPMQIQIVPHPEILPPVLAAMEANGFSHTIQSDEGITVICPRDQKILLFAALAPYLSEMIDIRITEPSLEDVFHGYSIPKPTTHTRENP
ncbi:MAG: ABC transporter ATP-binding protein [Burkholderiales bacterium]